MGTQKEDLQQAARDRGLDDTGTVEELQAKIDEHDATHASPPEPEPGVGSDAGAREVVTLDGLGDDATELHNALAALTAGAGNAFTFHESKPYLTEEGMAQLEALMDKVHEEYDAL